jgi:hypothetical protein
MGIPHARLRFPRPAHIIRVGVLWCTRCIHNNRHSTLLLCRRQLVAGKVAVIVVIGIIFQSDEMIYDKWSLSGAFFLGAAVR